VAEIEISIRGKERMAYIPRHLFAVLGRRARAIGNAGAVLLYPEKTDIEQVIESLQAIEHQLTLARNLRRRHPKTTEARTGG